jgi:hypothetical protein
MSCSAQISRTMVAMPKSPATSLRYALWSVEAPVQCSPLHRFSQTLLMEEYPACTPVNTRLGFDGPGGCAVLMKDPSLTETHRPSRIAAAIADPSSVTRTCVTAQLVAGAKRGGPEESVVRLPRWLLLELCPVSHKRSVPSTVALSAEAGIPGVSPERTVEFHQGISAGATQHGIIDRIKPHFLVQTLSWGIKEPPTLRFRGAIAEWVSRLAV